jgi:hypothetical protein
MRFLTAVALALVMLWVPLDGVAQDAGVVRASNEMVNILYEGRSCRRGNAALDSIPLERITPFLEQFRDDLNCSYTLYPSLEFEIRNAGPSATLRIHEVSSPYPYSVDIEVVTSKCLTLTSLVLDPAVLVWISLVTGEIYPYDGDSAPNVCRG